MMERLLSDSILAVIAAAACAMALWSCSRPSSDEEYVRTGNRDEYGRYVFTVDMSDSTFCYDVGLFCSFGCDDEDFASFSQIPFHMLWVSPEDKPYEEEVWLTRDMLDDETFYSKRFSSPYREEVVPNEKGVWKLYVTVGEDYIKKYDIDGLGVKLSRQPLWDTEN